jgi:hypothetical protein
MSVYKSSNERSFWISALTNRLATEVLMVKDGQRSMHILCDRMADRYLNVPKERRSTEFMPIYNPQDNSQWPELLGWLITIGEMTEVTDH